MATKARIEQMAEELLIIRPVFERYKELETKLKEAMAKSIWDNIEIAGEGRVFISESETVTIPVEVAREELQDLANNVIVVKESVSKRLFDALAEAGMFQPEQVDAVLERSKRTPRISLYVRPLK